KTAAGSCLPEGRVAFPECIKNPPQGHAGHRPERGRTPDEPLTPQHSPASERPLEQQTAAVWQGSGGAEPPEGAPDTASPARHERARPARGVPATDVRRPAGTHTTPVATRPSSGPPGRWQAPLARVQRWGVSPRTGAQRTGTARPAPR